jgi:hypothetical protein
MGLNHGVVNSLTLLCNMFVWLMCFASCSRMLHVPDTFDFAHRIKGSVPVQARDHRKRRCNHISADSHQRGNVTIPLALLAARGNDMRGATDFGPRGG